MALDNPLTGTPEERLKDTATLLRFALDTLDAFLDPDNEEVGALELEDVRSHIHMALELAQGKAEA